MTESQQKVLDLLNRGLSVEQIAKKLGREVRVINAQITRMKSTGAIKASKPEPKPPQEHTKTDPPFTDLQSVQDLLNKSGRAKYVIPDELKNAMNEQGELLDVNPMILLGVTIQFVKMCGGRIHAHQVIEDVFSALKSFAN